MGDYQQLSFDATSSGGQARPSNSEPPTETSRWGTMASYFLQTWSIARSIPKQHDLYLHIRRVSVWNMLKTRSAAPQVPLPSSNDNGQSPKGTPTLDRTLLAGNFATFMREYGFDDVCYEPFCAGICPHPATKPVDTCPTHYVHPLSRPSPPEITPISAMHWKPFTDPAPLVHEDSIAGSSTVGPLIIFPLALCLLSITNVIVTTSKGFTLSKTNIIPSPGGPSRSRGLASFLGHMFLFLMPVAFACCLGSESLSGFRASLSTVILTYHFDVDTAITHIIGFGIVAGLFTIAHALYQVANAFSDLRNTLLLQQKESLVHSAVMQDASLSETASPLPCHCTSEVKPQDVPSESPLPPVASAVCLVPSKAISEPASLILDLSSLEVVVADDTSDANLHDISDLEPSSLVTEVSSDTAETASLTETAPLQPVHCSPESQSLPPTTPVVHLAQIQPMSEPQMPPSSSLESLVEEATLMISRLSLHDLDIVQEPATLELPVEVEDTSFIRPPSPLQHADEEPVSVIVSPVFEGNSGEEIAGQNGAKTEETAVDSTIPASVSSDMTGCEDVLAWLQALFVPPSFLPNNVTLVEEAQLRAPAVCVSEEEDEAVGVQDGEVLGEVGGSHSSLHASEDADAVPSGPLASEDDDSTPSRSLAASNNYLSAPSTLLTTENFDPSEWTEVTHKKRRPVQTPARSALRLPTSKPRQSDRQSKGGVSSSPSPMASKAITDVLTVLKRTPLPHKSGCPWGAPQPRQPPTTRCGLPPASASPSQFQPRDSSTDLTTLDSPSSPTDQPCSPPASVPADNEQTQRLNGYQTEVANEGGDLDDEVLVVLDASQPESIEQAPAPILHLPTAVPESESRDSSTDPTTIASSPPTDQPCSPPAPVPADNEQTQRLNGYQADVVNEDGDLANEVSVLDASQPESIQQAPAPILNLPTAVPESDSLELTSTPEPELEGQASRVQDSQLQPSAIYIVDLTVEDSSVAPSEPVPLAQPEDAVSERAIRPTSSSGVPRRPSLQILRRRLSNAQTTTESGVTTAVISESRKKEAEEDEMVVIVEQNVEEEHVPIPVASDQATMASNPENPTTPPQPTPVRAEISDTSTVPAVKSIDSSSNSKFAEWLKAASREAPVEAPLKTKTKTAPTSKSSKDRSKGMTPTSGLAASVHAPTAASSSPKVHRVRKPAATGLSSSIHAPTACDRPSTNLDAARASRPSSCSSATLSQGSKRPAPAVSAPSGGDSDKENVPHRKPRHRSAATASLRGVMLMRALADVTTNAPPAHPLPLLSNSNRS